MYKWEVALTPSRVRGSRAERGAQPRPSQCVLPAEPVRLAAAFGARLPRRAPAQPSSATRVTVGRKMLAAGCMLLAALLAAPMKARACSAPDLPSDVMSSLPGANISLSCPAKDLRDNASVHWAVTNAHQRWASVERRLLLSSVQLSDSGNYSCYVNGHPAGMVRLLVEAPPEKPKLSCWRKNPLDNVFCEWSPQSAPSLMTKAVLCVKIKNPREEEYQKPCLYSPESQKFFCQFPIPEGDTLIYIVTACVGNSAGSSVSNKLTVLAKKILKPDPPANIRVTAVAGHPHWLKVTWKDPPSWKSNFYRLRFNLRYRAEEAETFSTSLMEDSQHQYIIPDAWHGHRHVVQLQAQEEFGIGSWSEWSSEATGIPWSEPRTSPTAPHVTEAPTTDEEDNTHYVSVIATSLPVQHSSSAALPAFLVAGGSLTFGFLLCIGLILRFKRTWKSRTLQECKPSMHPPYPLGQPRPTIVLVPLLSPPVSPDSLGSNNALSQGQPDAKDPQSPYDVSNRDYFSR